MTNHHPDADPFDDDIARALVGANLKCAMEISGTQLGILLQPHPSDCDCGSTATVGALYVYGNGNRHSDEGLAHLLRACANQLEAGVRQ